MSIASRCHRIHKPVADEATDSESHKEMLERHHLLHIDGQGDEEYGIAERPQHCRKIEHLNIDIRRQPEIHYHLVAENRSEADGQQAGVFLMQDLDPPHHERASENGTRQFAEREPGSRHRAIAEDCRRERSLQGLGCRAHHLHHEEQPEYRIELPVPKRRHINIWMSYMQHPGNAEAECHRNHQANRTEDIAVKPVIILSISKYPYS